MRRGADSSNLHQAFSEAARNALRAMNPQRYEYVSQLANRLYGQGLREGAAKGRAAGRLEIVLRQLSVRFGALPESIPARLQASSSEELDHIGERLLTASTLSEAVDSR